MSLTNPLFRGRIFARCAGASLTLTTCCPATEPGKMTREFWNGIAGNNGADFSSSPRWWQAPDSVATFPGSAAPSNTADNYAARIRAIVMAPITGNHAFWISSNNSSELLLSPNEPEARAHQDRFGFQLQHSPGMDLTGIPEIRSHSARRGTALLHRSRSQGGRWRRSSGHCLADSGRHPHPYPGVRPGILHQRCERHRP